MLHAPGPLATALWMPFPWPVRDIARELGVDALVKASLVGTADSVTIAARLVDGRTEQYRWSQSYATDRLSIPCCNGSMLMRRTNLPSRDRGT